MSGLRGVSPGGWELTSEPPLSWRAGGKAMLRNLQPTCPAPPSPPPAPRPSPFSLVLALTVAPPGRETTTPGVLWEGRREAPGEGREGGPSGCVFPASAAAAGDGVRAVRWRRQRWWSSREPSLYLAPTGRPPSTSSTPSVKVAAPSPHPRWPGSAFVDWRQRTGAGLAGSGAADSLCVCEGGRAGGAGRSGLSGVPWVPVRREARRPPARPLAGC